MVLIWLCMGALYVEAKNGIDLIICNQGSLVSNRLSGRLKIGCDHIFASKYTFPAEIHNLAIGPHSKGRFKWL